MKKFKIGGKITLDDNVSYRILDIFKYREKNYLFCCTITKPITPEVLQYTEENGKVYVKEEENSLALFEIARKLVKSK